MISLAVGVYITVYTSPIAHAELRVNNLQIVCNNIMDQFCNQCNYDLPKNKESTYKRTTDQLNVLITQMDVISTQKLHINRIHVKKKFAFMSRNKEGASVNDLQLLNLYRLNNTKRIFKT